MDFLKDAARRAPEAFAVTEATAGGPHGPVQRAEIAGPGPATAVRTYAGLDSWADQVATALVRAGVGPGARVGMRLPPCPEAVVLLHAVPRAGGMLVPLNPGWTQSEIMRGLAEVGPPALVFQTVGEVAEWSEDEGDEGVEPGSLPGAGAGHPAAILLTSGSTGTPRPVAISHRNLAASARGAIDRLELTPEDRWLASLSPAHVGGLALLHRAAVVGCGVLTRPRFDAAETAELIDSGEVTHASLVPVMLSRLLDVRGDRPAPPTLACLLLGGAAVPPSLLERALELDYPIALTYGLTEATSQVATACPRDVRRKPGSVGKPLSGVQVRIDGVRGAEGSGVAGEILVKGPTVVAGLRGPHADGADRSSAAESRAAVYRDRRDWLHTGDLGRLDAEGDLWVVGRVSERIVTGGVTVEPGDVESALAGHPAVREVAVVGVPDAEWGERVVAVVVPEDPSDPPRLEDLQAFARERLAAAKRPRGLHLLDALPRNPNGKVRRDDLRALAR